MPDVFIDPHKRLAMLLCEDLGALFDEVEKTLEAEGRDAAIPLMSNAVNALIHANKWDKANWASMVWNPEGSLTQKEFDELNFRRKKISNAIGIKTADGTIRHNLNLI
jgi:hypothetical protein